MSSSGKHVPSTINNNEKGVLPSVSIWRTYFLANEWNELHTSRKINPTMQYVVFVFLTEYTGEHFKTSLFSRESSESELVFKRII